MLCNVEDDVQGNVNVVCFGLLFLVVVVGIIFSFGEEGMETSEMSAAALPRYEMIEFAFQMPSDLGFFPTACTYVLDRED